MPQFAQRDSDDRPPIRLRLSSPNRVGRGQPAAKSEATQRINMH
jgi:hypothetical protein